MHFCQIEFFRQESGLGRSWPRVALAASMLSLLLLVRYEWLEEAWILQESLLNDFIEEHSG